MESRPATMAKASRAGATPHGSGLPEEIVIWEILVRLPPRSLLRCRAVCRAASARPFLQAHHSRQPSLPIVRCSVFGSARQERIFTFDHRAAGVRLQPVAQLDYNYCHEASCDGLLILSSYGMGGTCFFSVCNLATRQHAPLPLRQLSGFRLLGMYLHRPTGEYRLLLRRTLADQISCYVFVLGSEQPPRYVGGLEVAAGAYLDTPALVRDSLHWFPLHYGSDPQLRRTTSKVVIVFDTTSETFRHMRAPVVPAFPAKSYISEIDGTLGIYSYIGTNAIEVVDIWVLRNYESEVWKHKYNIKLPVEKIKEWFGESWNSMWFVSVQSVDGDVLLLVSHGSGLFYVDIDGKLVDNFHRDGQEVYANKLQLKQTLVPHTFFTTIEGYAMNDSSFI